MDAFGLDPSSYSIAINLFIRLLGAIYIIVYLPFLFEIKGLIGKKGILPIEDYLQAYKNHLGKRRFYYFPTLLWLKASDRALLALVWSGLVLGVLLMFGVFPPIVLLLLYIVHLSVTTAGQEFLSFGWETFLMELTLGAFFLVAAAPLNLFAWINLNLLLLRFYFQAGASKLWSHDKNWRNLTALSYHYLTQPLPNTTAWYFHKLPMWFHKLSVLIMFYAEMLVPFGIFAPPEIRLLVFFQLVGLQVSIWFTGNFSYLNHLTVVATTILLHNSYLEPFLGPVPIAEPSPILWQAIISLFAFGLLVLQIISFLEPFFPKPTFRRLLALFGPFHIVYPHGIFAVMTTKRYEIIVEGSMDGEHWQEYHFFFKPGDLSWRPRRVAPYQPRLDWQAWFLPFSSFYGERWFQQFLIRLLEGSPPVLKLLKHNPFPEKPPHYIRALMYDYEFTTFKEKAETGNWWKRTLVGQYAPTSLLKSKYTDRE